MRRSSSSILSSLSKSILSFFGKELFIEPFFFPLGPYSFYKSAAFPSVAVPVKDDAVDFIFVVHQIIIGLLTIFGVNDLADKF